MAVSARFSVESQNERIKSSIVEDDKNDRMILTRILERSGEFECVGLHETAEEALDRIPHVRPRLVLMDIRLPGMGGMECSRVLKTMQPGLIIVFISGLSDQRTIIDAMDSGGDGFLTKPVEKAQCLATIRVAFRRARLATGSHSSSELPALNQRENAVMMCIAAGLINKQIADKLDLTVNVVEYVIRRICNKLGAANRAEAVRVWQSAFIGAALYP
jgi:DNA-binding NarL/FixJ family response regulator